MDFPSQMVLFAHVVRAGSFSATARELDQTPSSVSKQIAQLEDRLGVRLLSRTKHGLSPTQEGHEFYDRCVEIAERIGEAETFANSLDDHPKGQLNVVSTVAFGKSQLLPLMPRFMAEHPDISVSLELTDRPLNMSEEGTDLAIRFTEQLNDTSVFRRKLSKSRRIICASPAYLERHGMPRSVSDLANHNCLKSSMVERWNDWHLEQLNNGQEVHLSGNFQVNSADGIYHAALAGVGIARLSTYMVNEAIATGQLVQLFPEYQDDSGDILAIFPEKRNLSSKVRVFIDYLVHEFGPVPPWERQID